MCTVLFSCKGSIIGLPYTSCNIFIVFGCSFFFLMAAKDIQITVKLPFLKKKDIFLNYLEHVSLIFLIKQNIYEMGFLLILDSSWLSDTNCNIYNIHQNLEFCKYWNSASVSLISLACKIWNFNIGTQNLHGMYVWSISNFALKHNFLGKQTISLRRFLILSTGMLYSSLFFTVHSSFYIHLTCRLFNFFIVK